MIYWQLLSAFFRVGLFGYGGGAALFPLIKRECLSAGFLGGSEERLVELFAVTNALPGVTAIKMAAYIGWEEGGLLGAIAAVTGIMTPGVALLFALYGLIVRVQTDPAVSAVTKARVEGLLNGLQFAAAGFIAYSLIKVTPLNIDHWKIAAGGILSVAIFALLFTNIHPIWLLVAAACIGLVVL